MGKPDITPKDGALTETMVYEKVYDWIKSENYWVVVGMFGNQQLRETMEELENRYFSPDTKENSKFWLIVMKEIGVLIYIFPRKAVSKIYIQTNVSGYDLPDNVTLIVVGAIMGMLPIEIAKLLDGLNTVAEARGEVQIKSEGR